MHHFKYKFVCKLEQIRVINFTELKTLKNDINIIELQHFLKKSNALIQLFFFNDSEPKRIVKERKEESKRDRYLEENVEVNNSLDSKEITQRKLCFRVKI